MKDFVTIQVTPNQLAALERLVGYCHLPLEQESREEDMKEWDNRIQAMKADLDPNIVGWVPRYMPFIMGGDVHRPAKAKLEVIEVVDIGKGFQVCKVAAPNGRLFYFEKVCGALLGDDLEMIVGDVEGGDVEVMNKQVRDGEVQRARAEMLETNKFWSYVDGSGEKRRII